MRKHSRDLAPVADILGHADINTPRHDARSDLKDRRAALEDLAYWLRSNGNAHLLAGSGARARDRSTVPRFHGAVA
jgi:hypothetical protein